MSKKLTEKENKIKKQQQITHHKRHTIRMSKHKENKNKKKTRPKTEQFTSQTPNTSHDNYVLPAHKFKRNLRLRSRYKKL